MSEERFDYEVDDATRFVDNLKDRVHDLYDKNEELKKENKRLNKVLDELEKTLLEWHEYWEDNDYYSFQYKNAYDYLQMLKKEDK